MKETDVFPVEFLVDVINNGPQKVSGKSISEVEAANILAEMLLTCEEKETQVIENFFLNILENRDVEKEVRFVVLVLMKDLSSLITTSTFEKLVQFEANPVNIRLVTLADIYLEEQR